MMSRAWGIRKITAVAAVIGWLATAAIAASVVTAAPALAVGGTELDLAISPASGSVSSVPTWSTSTACPSGYQTSAVLYELNTDGTIARAISPAVTDVSSPFTGTLLAGDTVGSVLAASNVTPGGTVQWVVECTAGPGGTGSGLYVQSVKVTLSPDGSAYTTSCTGASACLIPPSGASSLTPTWATTAYCPAAYLFSAALYTLNSDGSLGTRISPVVYNVGSPFSGTLLADVAQDISGTGVADGQTDEWEVVCFGPTGATNPSEDIASIYVTLSADGSSYTSSGTPPPLTATTTTMTASPQPTVTDTTITMTATVTVADGTQPAGSVVFEVDGLVVGPVAVNAGGVATATSPYVFSVAGSYQLEAVFTPANIFSYASSTGTFTESVNASTPLPVGTIGLIGLAALAGCALFISQSWRRNRQST